ncbi:MAG: NUDIX hydrolase, partial [Gammaproteobacteria bacterium]|nr:NUDIX hydrolase [Gammaproteobacteria bacterium]
RGQTVSLVFIARASGEPVAADDARNVTIVDPANPPPLAFDHDRILADYCRYRDRGIVALPD